MGSLKRRLPLFVLLAFVVALSQADVFGQSANGAQEAAPLPGQPLLPTATATNPNTAPVSSALPSTAGRAVRTTPASADPSDATPAPQPGQPLLPTAGPTHPAAVPISSALPSAAPARTIPAGVSPTSTITSESSTPAPQPGQPLLPTAGSAHPATVPISSALPSAVPAHTIPAGVSPISTSTSESSTPAPQPGQPLLPTAGPAHPAAVPISSALPSAAPARTIPAGVSPTSTSNLTAQPQPGQPLLPTAGAAAHTPAAKSVSSALTAPTLSSHSAAVNAHPVGAEHETLGLNGAKAEPSHLSKSDGHYQLDLIVTDGYGRAIRGLTQQDISIQDNQQPREIQSFHEFGGTAQPDAQPTPQSSTNPATPVAQEPPVELVLILDAVNTDTEHLALFRKAIENYLHQNGGQLAQPTSLVLFSNTGMTTHEHPTQDGNALTDFIAQNKENLQTTPPVSGLADEVERFKFSDQTFRSILDAEIKKPGRKQLIWFGPGWPLIHDADAAKFVDKTHQFGKKNQFNEIASLTNQLREARVTLDNIRYTPADGIVDTAYEDYLQGMSSVEQSDAAYLSLQVLAINSGGRVLDTINDVIGEIDRCAADAQTYYTVSFNSNQPESALTYHPLEIHLNKRGLQTRTTKAYYSVP